MNKFILIMVFVLSAPGCLTTAPYWIRRSIVHDDVIYVKETKKLHRRYIPQGIRLIGNKNLIKEVGPIIKSNNKIVVFRNYKEAISSGKEIISIDEFIEEHDK